ncbi:PP2C family protein-serine/threonine phosphatase [Occallatibacter savannae]|uniref:PP2C family protein-serine/threonine phosphatase n=1 Tax=Occallatibacter savannae TaxID=1002691 RepID=UPI0013A55970|nr:SpoIIE family protein phosphatase [Occallatibacter savannae]
MRFLSQRLRTGILPTLVGIGFLFLCPVSAHADDPAGNPATPEIPSLTGSHWAEQVLLGSSSVELNGPWKFHKGDDMRWAQPGFNDSGWASVDLTPPPGSSDPFLGTSGFMPGWTALGNRGYWGYAWYRLQANVQYDPGLSAGGLEIKMPNDVDDAYQVFVNGQQIGEFGKFHKSGVTTYISLPRAFALPKDISGGPITIAIRVWMDASTQLTNPDSGGLHGPPILGQAGPIDRMLRLDWDAVTHSQLSRFLEVAVLLLAITVCAVLFWLDRKENSYVWLGATCIAIALQLTVSLAGNYTTLLPGWLNFLLIDVVFSPAVIALWILFWAYWFRMGRMARMHYMVWGFTGGLMLTVAMMRAPLFGSVVPMRWLIVLAPLAVVLKLLLGSLLLWVAWEGMRKDHTGAWLALPALGLVAVSLYQQELLVLHLPMMFFPFGMAVNISQIAVVVSLNIITVLLMRRFVHSLRLRQQWEAEIDQARQIQQLLIPEAIPTVPGYVLETEYRPAQEVGGDFFQILPDGKGGVLILLGDVTGKGLQAGMQVALIVGVIRTLVETSFEPHVVLEGLNRRLCGRGQSYATCVAMHIDADGKTTIANAGHIVPYLNGKELTMTGNLPLGLNPSVTFDQVTMHLKHKDRLLVITDGVIEAKNAKNELFGFNRARSISHLPAAFIVKAAEIFGQEDDITVVSIARMAQEKEGEVTTTTSSSLKSEVA